MIASRFINPYIMNNADDVPFKFDYTLIIYDKDTMEIFVRQNMSFPYDISTEELEQIALDKLNEYVAAHNIPASDQEVILDWPAEG